MDASKPYRPARDQDGVVEGRRQEGRTSATVMAGPVRQARRA